MKLITLLCVCLSITAGTWAYSPKCAQGPKYWCRDASTARECGAVQRCEQTVWRAKESAKKPSTTGETAHMLCNVLVHASSEVLAAGSIHVDSIKEYIRQDCAKLPNQGNLVQQCEMAVDIYLADILRHLTSGTESSKICSIIQGHDTASMPIVKPKPSGVSSNQTCVLCEFIVQILATVASANSSAQELAHILQNICHEMPAVLRDECTSFISKYGVDIIALLVRGFDPAKVCTLIKLCTKSQNVEFLVKPSSKMCGLCDYVSTSLSAGLPKESVCKNFATENNLKEQCEVLVQFYKPNLCAVLPLCSEVIQPLDQTLDSSVQSAECSLCKYVVNYIDAVIQTNKSEAAIEAALEKVCTILPAPIRAPCKSFVDTYGPLLVQLIQKYGTADKVCDALKLCNNGTQVHTTLEALRGLKLDTKSLGTIPCLICKYVIGYLDTATKGNRSTAAIEAALEKVCNVLPSALKDNCTAFVHKYGPIIAILFKQNATAEQICNFIKVCNNGTETALRHGLDLLASSVQGSVKSVQCALCKYVVGYIDTVIQNNKSEAAIEAALEKVCSIVPAALKNSCLQFVDTYGPILVQLIEKYATAEQVCNALKLCHNGTEAITPLMSGLTRMLKEKKPAANGLECTLCKYVVSYIDSVIQNNKSEAAIEAALEKVCTIVPAAIKDKCLQFVDTYGPVLAQLIAKYATPEQVCNALKVCHNGTQSTESLLKSFAQQVKSAARAIKSPEKLASAECSLCKYVVNYIDAVIQTNKSEAAIEAALEKVCTILPAPIRAPCKSFVDTYGPLLVQLIQKYGTADKVCDALKLCNNGTQIAESISRSHPETITKSIRRLKDGGECTLCKYILNYVNLLIKSNTTAEELKKALEVVCSILPSAEHAKCKKFVTDYAPILAELIAELDDPNTVCQWLGLCSKSDKSFIQIPAVKRSKVQSLPCNMCEYVVHYLDAIVQSNSTETKFEDALDKACKVLPEKKLQAECKVLVHLYGGDLIKFLVQYGDPKAVCQALKICDK